jgi:hypothetical protein
MRWTADMDARLIELHAKRLGNTFIASWMRVTTFDVRARLVELGLKPSPGGKAPFAQAVSGPSHRRSEAEIASGEAFAADDADADEMPPPHGRPRGYLVSEADITAIYRRAGRGY